MLKNKKTYISLCLLALLFFVSFFYPFRKKIQPNATPLVSVIIPAYNHENFVQETLLSIINQTYKNIELIVIDDGSKDTTFQVIEKTLKAYPDRFVRTDISTQSNAGTTITLNRLLKKAEGDFVYLIASDDVAYPTAIEKELKFLQTHPDYVLAVGDNRFIDENGNPVAVRSDLSVETDFSKPAFKTFAHLLHVKPLLSGKGLYQSGLFGNYFELLHFGNHVPNGYLIRKSALDKFTFTPDAPLEDYYMMLQLSKLGKFEYIDEVLFSYRRHSANTNNAANHRKMLSIQNKTLDYENRLCIREPFSGKYFFEINLHKIKCKLKHLMSEG
ncbi:MAG: glycosyltransferase family 2 protein [Alphaproteobacteria bacterium]|nr:glycosyltransferase family 2 protein [Alphaproteobacteria bacterium]